MKGAQTQNLIRDQNWAEQFGGHSPSRIYWALRSFFFSKAPRGPDLAPSLGEADNLSGQARVSSENGKPKGPFKKILSFFCQNDTFSQKSYALPTAIYRLPMTAVNGKPRNGPRMAPTSPKSDLHNIIFTRTRANCATIRIVSETPPCGEKFRGKDA